MAGKRVKVVSETDSGRNVRFEDTRSGEKMSRAEFVKRIEAGQYPAYHVRQINGVDTPVSKSGWIHGQQP